MPSKFREMLGDDDDTTQPDVVTSADQEDKAEPGYMQSATETEPIEDHKDGSSKQEDDAIDNGLDSYFAEQGELRSHFSSSSSEGELSPTANAAEEGPPFTLPILAVNEDDRDSPAPSPSQERQALSWTSLPNAQWGDFDDEEADMQFANALKMGFREVEALNRLAAEEARGYSYKYQTKKKLTGPFQAKGGDGLYRTSVRWWWGYDFDGFDVRRRLRRTPQEEKKKGPSPLVHQRSASDPMAELCVDDGGEEQQAAGDTLMTDRDIVDDDERYEIPSDDGYDEFLAGTGNDAADAYDGDVEDGNGRAKKHHQHATHQQDGQPQDPIETAQSSPDVHKDLFGADLDTHLDVESRSAQNHPSESTVEEDSVHFSNFDGEHTPVEVEEAEEAEEEEEEMRSPTKELEVMSDLTFAAAYENLQAVFQALKASRFDDSTQLLDFKRHLIRHEEEKQKFMSLDHPWVERLAEKWDPEIREMYKQATAHLYRHQRDEYRRQRDEYRQQRNELRSRSDYYGHRLEKALEVMDEDREQIGMLKHHVKTLERRLEDKQQEAKLWQKAFEQNDALARIERIRRERREDGEDGMEDAATQTESYETRTADSPTAPQEPLSRGDEATHTKASHGISGATQTVAEVSMPRRVAVDAQAPTAPAAMRSAASRVERWTARLESLRNTDTWRRHHDAALRRMLPDEARNGLGQLVEMTRQIEQMA